MTTVSTSNAQRIDGYIRRQKFQNVGSPNDQVSLTPASYGIAIKTDVNELPYPRFYRGKAFSSEPVIWEREAGYAKVVHVTGAKFTPPVAELTSRTPLCFQPPCNTIFPCQPSLQNQMLGSGCVSISP